MLQDYELAPNIRTFGALSYSVTNLKLLDEFLSDLEV
jgi:hypothetical protein